MIRNDGTCDKDLPTLHLAQALDDERHSLINADPEPRHFWMGNWERLSFSKFLNSGITEPPRILYIAISNARKRVAFLSPGDPER